MCDRSATRTRYSAVTINAVGLSGVVTALRRGSSVGPMSVTDRGFAARERLWFRWRCWKIPNRLEVGRCFDGRTLDEVSIGAHARYAFRVATFGRNGIALRGWCFIHRKVEPDSRGATSQTARGLVSKRLRIRGTFDRRFHKSVRRWWGEQTQSILSVIFGSLPPLMQFDDEGLVLVGIERRLCSQDRSSATTVMRRIVLKAAVRRAVRGRRSAWVGHDDAAKRFKPFCAAQRRCLIVR